MTNRGRENGRPDTERAGKGWKSTRDRWLCGVTGLLAQDSELKTRTIWGAE